MKPALRSNLFALIVICIYILGGKFILGPMHLPSYENIVLAEIFFSNDSNYHIFYGDKAICCRYLETS